MHTSAYKHMLQQTFLTVNVALFDYASQQVNKPVMVMHFMATIAFDGSYWIEC